jgi:regulator of sirC expression with transglutaminase-like and TPR domain
VVPVSSRESFARIARLPDRQIDLAEAAFWVADGDGEGVDVPAYLMRVEALAREAASGVEGAGSERDRIGSLNRFLFVDQGFAGNREDYYDPANSYLNCVLDRRVGIPISLSILYIAVARRLGMDVHGVGFPGHFLVKHVGECETVIDPFFGCILDEASCRDRLVEVVGPSAVFQPDVHLRAASHREILVRLLSNLKSIWLRRRAFTKALAICDRILLLIPESPPELRDRGRVYEQLGCQALALADYERLLEIAPEALFARDVRSRIVGLRATEPTLH